MIAHHSEPPTLWPHGAAVEMNTSIPAETPPQTSSGTLTYGGPIVPLIPKPLIGKDIRCSSLSCSPPPPLVLGAPHLAHSVPGHSIVRGSRPNSAASSVISSGAARTLTPQGRVEISIVGSPEVFGAGSAPCNAQMPRAGSDDSSGDGVSKKTPPMLTIDEDERVIERCEQIPSEEPPHPAETRSIGSIVHGTNLNNSLCLPISGNNPEVTIIPLSPGGPDGTSVSQETREASNCSRQSVASSGSPGTPLEEATIKRRGSFSTGCQPPPKKRFVLTLDTSDETNRCRHHDSLAQLSGTQVHDGRVDRGIFPSLVTFALIGCR